MSIWELNAGNLAPAFFHVTSIHLCFSKRTLQTLTLSPEQHTALYSEGCPVRMFSSSFIGDTAGLRGSLQSMYQIHRPHEWQDSGFEFRFHLAPALGYSVQRVAPELTTSELPAVGRWGCVG